MLGVSAAAAWLGVGDLSFWVGLLGLGLLGLADDVTGLGARTKLLLQVLVLGVASVPWWNEPVHALLFVVLGLWSINVWNFMDGSNGLIITQAVLVGGVGAWMLDGPAAILAALLASAALGFLPFNVGRARVFLGDCGSYTIGFLVALIGLLAIEAKDLLDVLMVFTAGSAIWMDSVLTLSLRAWQGRRVTQAHRSHLYQWLIRAGWSHASVMFAYLVWGIIAIMLVLAWPAIGGVLVLSAAVTSYYLIKRSMIQRV